MRQQCNTNILPHVQCVVAKVHINKRCVTGVHIAQRLAAPTPALLRAAAWVLKGKGALHPCNSSVHVRALQHRSPRISSHAQATHARAARALCKQEERCVDGGLIVAANVRQQR